MKILIVLFLYLFSLNSWSANSTYIKGTQLVESNQSIVSSGGTLTLTALSPMGVLITGSSTHTVKLPNVTTIFEGFNYHVINTSSQAVSVIDSASTLVATVSPNTDKNFELYPSNLWAVSVGGSTGKSLVGSSPVVITQDATTATFSLSFTPENAANKSTNTALGSSDTLYPSQNAVKSYVDEKKLSVGATTLMNIIDNGGGNITSSVLDVSFNTLATAAGTIRNFTVGAVTATLTDGVTNYIVANYNNGSPIQQVITDVSLINETTIVPIATIFRSGNYLHTLSWDTLGNGLSNKIHQSIVKTQRYRRENGLALSEAGTRNVNITSGIIWVGANNVSILAAASATDNLFYFLRTGPSAWTTQVLTQYNNNGYFDGSTTAVLSNGRYAVNWVYRGVENQKHIYIVLGEGNYTLSQAQASQPPANLPQNITSHAVLVGRIIVLKGASTATQIDSAFSVAFSGASTSDHNSLAGLQGGTTNEFYHLTSAGKTAADTLTGTANYVSKFTGSGLTASNIFDNGTNVGVSGTFSVQSGAAAGTARFGADVNATTITDGVRKLARFTMPSFNTASPDLALFAGDFSSSGTSIITFGGVPSSASVVAATRLDFMTAATATTTGGSVRMTLDGNGNMGVGTTSPTTALHVVGDSQVSGYTYFGSPSVNGSYRMFVSGGALKIEKRISGTWTAVGQFDEL